MELANVRIGDRDLGCVTEVRGQERFVGDASLILLVLAMPLKELRPHAGAAISRPGTVVEVVHPLFAGGDEDAVAQACPV